MDIEIGEPFEITVYLKSSEQETIEIHNDLKDLVMISSISNSCQRIPLFLNKRKSETKKIELGPTPYPVKISGMYYLDKISSLSVIDFYSLGKICVPLTKKSLDVKFTLFPKMDMFTSPHDAKGISTGVVFNFQ